ncbi:DUF6266 family protein [Sphingobacterium tabacisoli]|uniref:DUF6266 family protein n=1 Tax=Sphingobacterium tabacisoli TaxID=2044855 RepID=A0ABW5L6V8_9SPHI|nr:DUF6266 family protein [Sphingobacterium tabacisoli]
MGTIRNGANGGFKGKAGSVIGSSWKNVDYIKGLYKKRTKPSSPEQLEQQARFKLITSFLNPIVPMLRIGFGQLQADRNTPANVALAMNINRAVAGSYPDFTLDYPNIRISEGNYLGGGTTAASVTGGQLTVTWSTLLNTMADTRPDDTVYILLYQPDIEEFFTPAQLPTRQDGQIEEELPAHFLGGKGHVWLFFSDRKAKKVSRSSYLGELDLV